MDTTTNTLNNLFAQLGLDHSPEAVERFLVIHRLRSSQRLEEAPFWNESQREFLTEERLMDAEWSETIDVLDTLLRR